MVKRPSVRTLLAMTWLALLGTRSCQANTAADVRRVLENHINVSDPYVRPVRDQHTTVQVTFDAYPIAFSDFDEVAQKLSGSMWLAVSWTDELIPWNPSDYNWTFSVRPNPKFLWRPNIAIVNTFDELKPVGGDFVLLQAMYNGTIYWYPGFLFEVFCKMDITKYPFDTQTCYFELFSWGDFETDVNLTISTNGLRLDNYLTNGEWELTKSWTEKYTYVTTGIQTIKIFISLRRLPSFIAISVLVPVFFLALMNIMVFAIPVESGEKISYAITVLLSLAVFLSFISNMMPQTSETISILTILIALQLGLSSLYIVLTIVVMRLHQRGADEPVTGCYVSIVRIGLPSLKSKVHDIIVVQEKEPSADVTKPKSFNPEKLTWHMVGRAIDNICLCSFCAFILLTCIVSTLGMAL